MEQQEQDTKIIRLIEIGQAKAANFEFVGHPKHKEVTIHGCRLKPGDLIVPGTYFSAPTGIWKEVSPELSQARMRIGDNPRDIYVQPSLTPFAPAPKTTTPDSA